MRSINTAVVIDNFTSYIAFLFTGSLTFGLNEQRIFHTGAKERRIPTSDTEF
jgi:hypothetical protein